MKRALVLSAVLGTCIATIHGVPQWLLARPGGVAYTGAGERDSRTTPICPSAVLYRAYAAENSANGCVEQPMGVRVVIDSVIPATRSLGAIAKLHARDGTFHGYTAVAALMPAIPHGVPVTLEASTASRETLTISTDQSAELGSGSNLGVRAAATTMRFDSASADKRDLFVRVDSGKYRGRRGWIFARQAFYDGRPLDTLVVISGA